MKPSAKLRLTGALFWSVLLGLIFLCVKVRADEGREREREHDREDERNECVVPEVSAEGAAVLMGIGIVCFGLWKHYQNKNRGGSK